MQGSTEVQGVYLASLDDPKGKRIVATDARAVFSPPDTLLFLRQGTVLAQRFDVNSAALVGEPVRLAERVLTEGAFNAAALTASTTGLIAYREGSGNELRWVDRTGRSLGVLTHDPAPQNCPEISPDGQHVALDRSVAGNRDIWIMELSRNVGRRFTFDAAIDATPVWSPDGARLAFRSLRTGVNQIYIKAANGAGTEEHIPAGAKESVGLADWLNDGKTLLISVLTPATSLDLLTYSLTDRTMVPVANTPFEEREGQFSPDGKWLAFASNESGRMEIWVQAYPNAGQKWQVSTNGGSQPRWKGDSRELFYIAANGALMAAPFTASPATKSGSASVRIQTPVALFTPLITTAQGGFIRQQYAVSKDGNRFLLNAIAEDAANAPVTIISNWRGLAR